MASEVIMQLLNKLQSLVAGNSTKRMKRMKNKKLRGTAHSFFHHSEHLRLMRDRRGATR